MIPRELAGFLEQGLGIHLGTRDAHLQPSGCRALAARVEPDGRRLVVYLPRSAATRVLRDLEDNGQVAVSFGRPEDDRACQVKGNFLESWEATNAEQPFVSAQREGFLQQLERIGISRVVVAGWETWPAVAIRLRVTALFEQTPGPQAGTPLT